MARPKSYNVRLAEEWRAIDLAELRRHGMLDPDYYAKHRRIPALTWTRYEKTERLGVLADRKGVTFIKRNETGQHSRLFVPYTFTPAQFDGYRRWFQCPACRKACRILYGYNGLRCRRCQRLQYSSQYEPFSFRLLDRASKIRRRLGKSGNSGDPIPPKPRYMRWAKYRRLEDRISELEQSGGRAMSAQIETMRRSLSKRRS